MPVALSYPGVYVEEVPSGVRTITGVATSITAFVGRAVTGPVDTPVTLFSFGDFQRRFGGLGVDFPMSYAVADFFQNGGGQAIVVRVFKGGGGAGRGSLTLGGLLLQAATPGTWSDGLEVVLDNTITDETATRLGLDKSALFNLTATLTRNGQTVAREQFLNLTTADTPNLAGRAQRIDRVLQASSQLLTIPDPAKLKAVAFPAAPAAPAAGSPPPSGAPPASAGPPASARLSGTLSGGDDQSSSGLARADYTGDRAGKKGLYALEKADLFNLLCIPPDTMDGDTDPGIYQDALQYCRDRRAILIVDPPATWGGDLPLGDPLAQLGELGLSGDLTRNAALYFPRVSAPDPLSRNQQISRVPCGLVAGAMSATDAQRGVWKAPAGIDAGLNGISALAVNLTDGENGILNQLGVNCLRNFPVYGNVVWGARTLRGADQMADEYKYLPVRRLALFIEESLFRGTQWVVFEPNDEPLWAQIRLNVGAFMHTLFVKGAFQGTTPASAYFVRCDKDTTTQNDIDLGIVNISVGFAPLKPAEFVVLQIQQIAGDIQT